MTDDAPDEPAGPMSYEERLDRAMPAAVALLRESQRRNPEAWKEAAEWAESEGYGPPDDSETDE
jgi:hypothetical protein